MHLIIEQGNSSMKVAVTNGGRIVDTYIYKQPTEQDFAALFERYPLTKGIYSTVVDRNEVLLAYLASRLERFFYFDETLALPVTVAYQTPQTLGKDRIAAVVGAYTLQPGRNLLVIDAGTAITYEVVEAGGVYVGGNISPGMTTRFRALHEFTRRLPLVNEKHDVPLIGYDTESAIRAGVVGGIIAEMDGYIELLKQKYPDLLVFLTGGHSFYFESRLKSPIFADINLVLIGLDRILKYNVED